MIAAMGMSENLEGTSAGLAEKLEKEVVAVYQEHAAELLRYASSVAHRDGVARDAVQEVFLRYFIERRHGRTIKHPRAWLYQTIRNYLFDYWRDAAAGGGIYRRDAAGDGIYRGDAAGEGEMVAGGLESLPDQKPNPERQVRGKELAREVMGALSPRELDCLRLRAEGFSYVEIARIMRVRPGTIGALLSRVSKKLRRAAPRRPPVAFALADALRFVLTEDRAYSP